jgi:hypothetical protein
MKPACGEMKRLGCLPKQRKAIRVRHCHLLEDTPRAFRIGAHPPRAKRCKARALTFTRRYNAGTHLRTAFAGRGQYQVSSRHRRNLYLQIDTVEERSRNAGLVVVGASQPSPA